jgi:hypothetical protein
MNSVLALVLVSSAASAATVVKPVVKPAATPVAVAKPAAPAVPAVSLEVEAMIRDAAQLEKSDGCEAAYLKYRQAGEKTALVQGRRAAELQGIVANKLDKLEACFKSCQPNDHQRELLGTARSVAESEPRRAAQIARKLLVGRSVDRCVFWSDARSFLRTLPNVADEMDSDKVDPCELSAALQKVISEARDTVKKERSEVADLNYDRSKLPLKMNDLAELYRSMDQTRMLLFELREGLIDCESQHKPLAQDAQALRESFALAQEMMLGTYQAQLATLTKKIRGAEAKLAHQDELLTSQIGEQERLKKQLDGLSALNEELYNDLFSLAQAESVSFSVQVEGRRVEQPIEEVRSLMANEKKVLETLTAKYPEYFKDGVNVEGLKRKKLVLEKLEQMLKRYGTKPDSRLGYSRAVAEIDATIQMMDKAAGAETKAPIASNEPAPEKESSGAMPWFLGGGGALAVAGLTFLRLRSAK